MNLNTSTGQTEYFIKWLNYSEKCNSWQPKENVKILKPKRERKLKKKIAPEIPIKILSRFENNFCLVKWKNRKTSVMKVSTKLAYEIITNGAL